MNLNHDEYIEIDLGGIRTLATNYAITFSTNGTSVDIPTDIFLQKLVVLIRAGLLTGDALAAADLITEINLERANDHFH